MDSTVPWSTHRYLGISPFAVSLVTAEQASSRRRQQVQISRASTIIPNALERDESSPNPIPTDYHVLVSLSLLASPSFGGVIRRMLSLQGRLRPSFGDGPEGT
jgi:hypothetical protein